MSTARALTAARVRVPEAHEAEYLATLAELARLGAAAGRHLWVFRSADDPRLFLEFSESRTRDQHRHVAAASPAAAALERRLRELGDYAPDAGAFWTEVTLCPAASSS